MIKIGDLMVYSAEAELRAIALLAPAGYYLGIRIGLGGADKVYNTYPDAWQQRYAAMSYLMRGPTIAWAYEHSGTAHWRDLELLDSAGIFADAARHGLVFGVTFAMGPTGARTIGSFARADRSLTQKEVDWLHGAVKRMHEEKDRDLTPRERQALSQIAAGIPYAIAAHELGITESALRARLAAARKRLGAKTTAQAIRIARDQNII